MIITALFLTLALLPPTPTEVTVVQFPARGKVTIPLGAKAKADVERTGTVTRASLQIDGVQPAQAAKAGMNAYVVWAVSPEGTFDSMGELELSGAKGTLQATTRFDRFALLVTLEPHYLVERPSANISFKNDRSRDLTNVPVTVEVGAYEYPAGQGDTAGVPGLVMQARAAMAIAAGAQAAKRAESEFRQAQVAMDTMEELFRRASGPDVVSTAAHSAIRRAHRAWLASQSAR